MQIRKGLQGTAESEAMMDSGEVALDGFRGALEFVDATGREADRIALTMFLQAALNATLRRAVDRKEAMEDIVIALGEAVAAVALCDPRPDGVIFGILAAAEVAIHMASADLAAPEGTRTN